jgi:glycosyltransferase involved in cell wall biosynthesis
MTLDRRLFHLKWPFLGIAIDSLRSVGWCVLAGPLRKQADADCYEQLRRSFKFIGFTSYTTFPKLKEGVVSDYETLCEAWCHCFRDPNQYLLSGTPRTLLSESDFADFDSVSPAKLPPEVAHREKEFDFIYVCLPGRWAELTKNWYLAKRCLRRLCCDLNLKGLLLGRWQILDLPLDRNLTIKGDVPHHKLLECLHNSRMLFVPSIMDASPRILAESLCMNVPIMVHREILGGWKYVNASTGSFFQDEDDIAQAALSCLEGSLSPRAWFQMNYGPDKSSLRLSGLVSELDSTVVPTASWRLTRCTLMGHPDTMVERRGEF